MAPEENQAQAQQSSGSFWITRLWRSYMMGRLMGGGAKENAQQPAIWLERAESPAHHAANIPMRQVKLRRGATGPDNDQYRNRIGAGNLPPQQPLPAAVLANPIINGSTMQRSASTSTSARSMGG